MQQSQAKAPKKSLTRKGKLDKKKLKADFDERFIKKHGKIWRSLFMLLSSGKYEEQL